MPKLLDLLLDAANERGFNTEKSSLAVAPEFGGSYKSDGFVFRNGDVSVDLGKYSTNHGENYYGFLGKQPVSVGNIKLGAGIGGYTPSDVSKLNLLAGLLASTPIMNGEMRAILSPSYGASQPGVFLGYTKNF